MVTDTLNNSAGSNLAWVICDDKVKGVVASSWCGYWLGKANRSTN